MKFRYSNGLPAKIVGITALAMVTTLSFASWTSTGGMHFARASHTATILTNGLVLVAGGTGGSGDALVSSELYNRRQAHGILLETCTSAALAPSQYCSQTAWCSQWAAASTTIV